MLRGQSNLLLQVARFSSVLLLTGFMSQCSSDSSVTTRGEQATDTGSGKETTDFEISSSTQGTSGVANVITWTAVEGATSYTVVISTVPTCESPTLTLPDIEDTSQKIVLNQTGTYYICVDALLKSGQTLRATNNGTSINIRAAGQDVEEEAQASPSPSPAPSNVAPTFAFVEPNGTNDAIAVNGTFSITWTDSDSDDDATISLYYKGTASGACNTGTAIAGVESEDANGTSGSHSWDTTGISVGSYYICASIDDGTNAAVETWSANMITIANTPVLTSYTQMYAKTSVQLSHTFAATSGTGPYTYALTTNPGSVGAIDSSTGIFTFTPGSTGDTAFVVEVTDANSLTDSFGFTVHTNAYHICVWTGDTDTDFATAGNWEFCAGNAPQTADQIAIDSSASNQPTLAASTTVDAFGDATYEGGTLIIAAGAMLTVANISETISSSATITGDTAGCTTCIVRSQDHFYILNDANLTLGTGIIVELSGTYGKRLFVGNGVTSGHLKTLTASGTQSEWPIIRTGSTHPNGHYGIVVEGTASNQSSLDVDGLQVARGSFSQAAAFVTAEDYYTFTMFDNVSFDATSTSHRRQGPYIKFTDCTNGVFTDLTLTNLQFLDGYTGSLGYNIDASACSGIGPITVSGLATSPGYGAPFENDPNAIIDWIDGSTSNCTWNGNTDTSWTNTSNWDNCTNNRNNYPDHLDYVVIPTGRPNDPTITGEVSILGFGNFASGGGTLTVAAGADLFLTSKNNDQVSSDIVIVGDSASCTTCEIYTYRDLFVVNGATLTLRDGINWFINSQDRAYIGDGSTAGHLATGAANATQSYWPTFTGTSSHPGGGFAGFVFEGVPAGTASSMNIDGLQVSQGSGLSTTFEFISDFQIDGFDNVSVEVNTDIVGQYVWVKTCATGTINDVSWDSIDLYDAINTGYNVRMQNCSGLGADAISISQLSGGSNLGFGSASEDDADGVLFWTP